MNPGFYVGRMPERGIGSRLIIESICFQRKDDAESWCDFIKSQHPKDDVFLIERPKDDR